MKITKYRNVNIWKSLKDHCCKSILHTFGTTLMVLFRINFPRLTLYGSPLLYEYLNSKGNQRMILSMSACVYVYECSFY